MTIPYLISLEDLLRGQRVAIYGAGSAGVKFKSDLDRTRRDIELVCFVDSFKSGWIEHVEIVSSDVMEYSAVDTVVICSEKYHEIHEWLSSKGVTNHVVFNPSLNDVYLSATRAVDGAMDTFAFADVATLAGNKNRIAPCHLEFPFVQYNGDVFPCCSRRGQPEFKIGNIADANFRDAFFSYAAACSCESARLRPIAPTDPPAVALLNAELSLACQADCAMCCVNAPEWKSHYDRYPELTRLIDDFHVKAVLVQGGEVLIQKKSLEWIERTRERHPDIKFFIVSNGSVPLAMAPLVERLFDRITISVVGFTPGTYRRIMGLDLDRMRRFAERLLANNVLNVTLKYLCTPLSLPEADAFLSWAIPLAPQTIGIFDANFVQYINLDTADHYWLKIIQRTEKDVKKLLADNAALLAANRTNVVVQTPIKVVFNLNAAYLKDAGLEAVVS